MEQMVLQDLDRVYWSRKYYTPSELAKKGCFPLVVKIATSILGDRFYEDYSSDQVLYLHSVKEQFRFLAEDGAGNEISLPINGKISIFNEQQIQKEMLETEYEQVHPEEVVELPLRIKTRYRYSNQGAADLTADEDDVILNVKQRGWMKYIIGTCICNDGVAKHIECIPAEYNNISVQVALNIGDGTEDQLAMFEARVRDVIKNVITDIEFDSYQGNPEIIVNAHPGLIMVQEKVETHKHLRKHDIHTLINVKEVEIKKEPGPTSLKGDHGLGASHLNDVEIGASALNDIDIETSSLNDMNIRAFSLIDIETSSLNDMDIEESNGYCVPNQPIGKYNHSEPQSSEHNMPNPTYLITYDDRVEQLHGYCALTSQPYEAMPNSSEDTQYENDVSNSPLYTELPGESIDQIHPPLLPPRNHMELEDMACNYTVDTISDKLPKTFNRLKKAISSHGRQQDKIRQDKIKSDKDLPEDLSKMNGHQVQDCLGLLKLEKYIQVFEKKGVDGSLLVDLDRNIMKTEFNLTDLEILKLQKFIKTKWIPC